MYDVPLIGPAYEDWYCANGCNVTERTERLPANASRFHTCAKLHMLTAPLVRAGADCKVEAVERADYLGQATQRTGDNGRPYMSVVTEYADGHTDLAVFAEPAVLYGGK